MMAHYEVNCWSYLDDFMTCSLSKQQGCHDQAKLMSVLRDLGFYIAWPKVQGPSTRVQYLGFLKDSIEMKCLLPDSKLSKLENEWVFWSKRSYATKKQIQRLIGLLNHACKVVIPGRLYMYNIYRCLHRLETSDREKLDQGFWEDLLWWVKCLRHRNGIDIGVGERPVVQLMIFVSDSDWQYASELSQKSGRVVLNTEGILGVTKRGLNIDVYIEEHDPFYDLFTIDLLLLWYFLVQFISELRSHAVIIYCHRNISYTALKKLSCKDPRANNVLKLIMSLCLEKNVALIPFFDPIQ